MMYMEKEKIDSNEGLADKPGQMIEQRASEFAGLEVEEATILKGIADDVHVQTLDKVLKDLQDDIQKTLDDRAKYLTGKHTRLDEIRAKMNVVKEQATDAWLALDTDQKTFKTQHAEVKIRQTREAVIDENKMGLLAQRCLDLSRTDVFKSFDKKKILAIYDAGFQKVFDNDKLVYVNVKTHLSIKTHPEIMAHNASEPSQG